MFKVYDPKERTICAAAFPERVMHHAIMNVLEPFFERGLVYHSYACRKGKGMHAALRHAFSRCKAHPWFLKLDVRKYFDSADHAVLMGLLGRLFKEQAVLQLFKGLLESYHTQPGKGLPIGNLTSQHCANFYLSGLDHFILERLKPGAYARYMDDFVVWADEKAALTAIKAAIEDYCENHLKLRLKEASIGKSCEGLHFLGFRITPKGIYLLQKSRRRMRRRRAEIVGALYRGYIDEAEAARRAIAVNAAVLLARSRVFRATLWAGSGLGHEPR